MPTWERIFHDLDSLRQQALDFFGLSPASAFRLHTADEQGVLVADDASMASLIALDGGLRLVGEAEFEEAADRLEGLLASPLASRAHALQLVFTCDPRGGIPLAQRQLAPARRQARRLGLDLDGVLEGWARAVGGYCQEESVYVAVWTRPSCMTRAELAKARREQARGANLPASRALAQSDALVVERMRGLHLAKVKDLAECFTALRWKARPLSSSEALLAIRRLHVPSLTAEDWRPRLFGDALPCLARDPGAFEGDVSGLLPPTLARQLWPCPARVIEGRYLECGRRLHAPLVMSLPPQTMLPFNALFRSLLAESLPWRAAFLLTGDGLRGQSLKSACAAILAFASPSTRMLRRSLLALEEASLRGQTAVGFQASFDTWVDLDEPALLEAMASRLPGGKQGGVGLAGARQASGLTGGFKGSFTGTLKGSLSDQDPAGTLRLASAVSLLALREARLATAVQSWGSSDTSDRSCDPLAAYAATLPACTPASPAPKACAPLFDAVRLLPLSRPCSPWDQADVPLRTPDGRFMPLALFSSRQASWNELGFAGMGQGKSFFLNTLNFFYCLKAGLEELPWLTVVDIGPSCRGLIGLLEESLPPERRHLACYARLRNERESAVNPFDTPLGLAFPLPSHRAFLTNLLSLLCTPLSQTAPADGVADLLEEAVDQAYRRLAPEGESPRPYDPWQAPRLARHLGEAGFGAEAAQGITWWDCVRFCFDAGEHDLALEAQRYAVPTLSDVMAEAASPLVRGRFQSVTVPGSAESVPDACVRHLTSAVRDYPILANPTRFGIGAARVVGLDLMEVTPRGGPAAERQSGIMYLLARFVGAGHFFHTLADLDRIPEPYRSWHRPRFERLAAAPKRLCYDEFHRASCQDMANPLSRQIMADLATASRESRKQNLSIGLYSQSVADFPDTLVNLASSVYILGAGSAQEAEDLARRFGLSRAALEALRRIARPTAAGASFIALHRTGEGESVQLLTSTAGPHARWAFSTTAEDMRVRGILSQALGLRRALDLLARCFPSGSVKAEIERRGRLPGHRLPGGQEATSQDLASQIAEELLARTGCQAMPA
ncbi:MAG: hypothetical protein K6C33_05675 [Desulfovibrio sp.]|nr:hypothetical protein [Desulfovibrio sp.]